MVQVDVSGLVLQPRNIELEESTAFIASLLFVPERDITSSVKAAAYTILITSPGKERWSHILDTPCKNLQTCPQPVEDHLSQKHAVRVRIGVILAHQRGSISIC